ncbi:30S ribosome-binding factor RbfA [Thermosediminibacter oceani]|uniref:Ribosome-binding factor A n=1 Tax=Thermosediminibacter oceani (strain ATCC BAA-1034 / DSM 16646 / JW/IW-1228P) TaxID=555079 RepID=D9S3L5_THEOJ|nr:30S ribosome-binding factor RbfA [Thermosediminibacter oceani]ADL07992.1 ribosome-binding factor A [Thermosediminibacter oceani DSM 16646]
MEFSRTDRVSGEIKKAVSEIINNDLKDPRIQGLISVTKVEVSKDLRHAKIFLSIYGEESVKQNALEGIKNAEGFIRRELANRIRLKFIPQLNFKLDDSIEYGIHISKLLKDINSSGNED